MSGRSIAAVIAVALIGMGAAAPSASAEFDNSDTRYYVGKDRDEGWHISFVVRADAVRETFAGGGPIRCDGRRTRLFKSWGAAELKGTAFQRTVSFEDEPGSKFTIAGHVRGASAAGRLRNRKGPDCDTGTRRWEAERVSKDEFDRFRQLGPRRAAAAVEATP
jgi:hypothetical protein